MTTLPILPPEIRKIIWEIKLISECTESEYGYALFICRGSDLVISAKIYRKTNIHDVFLELILNNLILSDESNFTYHDTIDITGKKWETKYKKETRKKIQQYWKNQGVIEFFRQINHPKHTRDYAYFVRNDPAIEFLGTMVLSSCTFEKIFSNYQQLLQWKPNKIYNILFVQVESHLYSGNSVHYFSCEIQNEKEMEYMWGTTEMKKRLLHLCQNNDNCFVSNVYYAPLISLCGEDNQIPTLDPDEFWNKLTLVTIKEDYLIGYCIVPATPDVKRILEMLQ